MVLYRTNNKLLFASICCIVLIIGCTPNTHRSLKKQTCFIVEEYVNRIIKRLLIVSESPKLPKLDLKFNLNLTNKIVFKVNQERYQITISKGILEKLQDEAELAAILAMALTTLEPIAPYNFDKKIINHMYKAGYDPMAYVALQEKYLVEPNINHNWLKTLFSINPNNLEEITQFNIDENKKLTLNLSRGLQRGQQRYFVNIRLLKKLD